MDIGDFLAMGGYAGYVWPAYALTAIVLVYNAWSAARLRREQLASARRRAGPAQDEPR
ncbi:MAG TPA: heme exporter protein CcmD [Steroidobacteraceae bacterium]